MRKVLFLGCNPDQIPYLKEIKKLNYFVVGTDMNKNAPGIKYLDKYYESSYEDSRKLISIGKKEGFNSRDKIFTAGSQFAYKGASRFARYFKIKFVLPKNVDICLSKIKFYRFLQKNKISLPETSFVTCKEQLRKKIKENSKYFLKSDFSKNPNYVYFLDKGIIGGINWKHDRYFRKYYVLQEMIKGSHYRINYYNDSLFFFYKKSDSLSMPSYGLESQDLQKELESKIFKIISAFGLENYFVKFDIINTKDKYYIIDIGLDPPLRFKLLADALGYNFARLYVSHYLSGKDYPDKKKLVKDIIITGRKVKKKC